MNSSDLCNSRLVFIYNSTDYKGIAYHFYMYYLRGRNKETKMKTNLKELSLFKGA